MGLNRPHTPEEIANLKAKAEARWEKERAEKSKGAPASGAGGADNKGGASAGGGGNNNGGGAGGVGAGDSASNAGGGGTSGGGAKTKTGRKIPRREGEKTSVIVLDADKFLAGFPHIIRWAIMAGRNLIGIWNWLAGSVVRVEIEEFTREELDSLSEATKPGVKALLPNLGRKHPVGILITTALLAFVAKVKLTFGEVFKKKMKNVTPGATPETPASSAGVPGGQ